MSVNDGFCALARVGAAAFRHAEMPSLRQLLAAHAPLLVLDAASARVQIGWLGSEGRARWHTSAEESGVGIFEGLENLSSHVDEAGAFLFCEGPGSVLGVRTAAMALRTWCMLKPRAVFGYSSLAIVAHALDRAELGVIADARRESWHHYQMGRGWRRIPATELNGPLVMPEHFRHWSLLPAGVELVPYSLAEIFPRVADGDLFHETVSPDAFLHEEPSYLRWEPKIHRAPGRRDNL